MPTAAASANSCRTRSSNTTPSFAPDGKSVLFTSERNGAGQSDVFRARLDGTGIEPVVTACGGRRCGRAFARWNAPRLRVDAQRLPRQHLGARSEERPVAQPDRRRRSAGRSRRPQLLLPAFLVPGRPVARVLLGPQHRLARPQRRSWLGAHAGAQHLCDPRGRRKVSAALPPSRATASAHPSGRRTASASRSTR